jgi:hypothetical protein
VVTIYLDPDAEGVTSSHLKAFERGAYGPIFGPKQSQQSTATQQASSYTHLPTTISTNYGTQVAVPRAYSYQMPTIPSGYGVQGGYTSPSGYPAPIGYQVPSGYDTPSGRTAPSGQATTPMIQPSTNLYDENDENDDEPEEKKD